MLVAPDGRILLVEHATWHGRRRNRWGLPGGRLEWREPPVAAACRELREELGIDLAAAALTELGDHRYKGALHRIFGAEFAGPLGHIDSAEIVRTRWFELADIEQLEHGDRLHAGFEYRTARQFVAHLEATRD